VTLEVVTKDGQLWGWLTLPTIYDWLTLTPGHSVTYALDDLDDWRRVGRAKRPRTVPMVLDLFANAGAQARLVFRAEPHPRALLRQLPEFTAYDPEPAPPRRQQPYPPLDFPPFDG
jgi:hypothetical protein